MLVNRVRFLALALVVLCVPSLADGAGFSLVPVGSTGAHAITGQEIRIPAGAATVTLEVRVFDWDPNHDGNPLLHGCQAQIGSAGFTSGSSGSLTAGRRPCVTNADCPAGRLCMPYGFCDMSDHVFVDPLHPNYVFFGLDEIHVADFSIANMRYGAVVIAHADAVPDTGAAKYVGTLRLDVSPDARGTFTVDFTRDDLQTFLIIGIGVTETPTQYVPARITIVHEDCNVNGVNDAQDIASGTSRDCNNSGVPDECENDCNANGWADECDIADGCSQDCNNNGTPDECEEDCNRNGFADGCDLAVGTSLDCDGDGVPDECQGGSVDDCNNNGRPDWCDVISGASNDCNYNGIPDECELAGGSADCNHNGVLDECEPDCNANGVADACDISGGSSLDTNGDGVPDECKTTVAWVPVHASRGYYVNGNSVVLPAGGARITLEARISGWDLDRDGDPGLHLYQVSLDSTSLTSGSTGSLGAAQLACTSNNDCRGSSLCVSGVCDNDAIAFIDESRADFALSGHDGITAVDVSQPNFRFAALLTETLVNVADDGRAKYGATLILDATPDATGTFSIGFLNNQAFGSFLMERDLSTLQLVDIPIGAMRAATVTILDDCNANGTSDQADIAGGTSQDCDGNGFPDECDMTLATNPDCNGNGVYDFCESPADCNANGVVDLCDLANGTSEDANSNGVPDECEAGAPAAFAMGGRYLEVEPVAGAQAVALRVTSPNYVCLTKYVTIIGGVGQLSNTPDFRTPQQWGRILVKGTEITPAAMYDVAADFGDGLVSAATRAQTGRWGDVVPPLGVVNYLDIVAIVDRFKDVHCAVPVALADLYPANPDGKISFLDIAAGVDAFKGKPYPYGPPCP